MSICIEVLLPDTSGPLNRDLKNEVLDAVRDLGIKLDVAEYTPTADKLAELAATTTGRAKVNVYTS